MSAALEIPPRPYVPPSASGALAALSASAMLLEGAWRAYCAGEPLPWGTALVTGAVCAALFAVVRARRPACAPVLWFLAGAALAGCSCAFWMRSMDASRALLEGKTASAFSFEVAGDPSVRERGASVTARACAEGRALAASVRLNLAEPAEPGDVLEVVGRMGPLDDGDWGRSRFMRGEVASVDAVRVLAQGACARSGPVGALRRAMLAAVEPAASEARALIAGIVCGRTTELNQAAASDDFAAAGLTHLVAVSGSHLALIAALLQGTLRRLGFGRVGRAALLIGVMAVYVVFTGGAASAARSLVMVGASMAAGAGGRRDHALSGLALAALALALQNPGVVFDLGFQLSAMSVLFIGLFYRYGAYLLERLRVPRALAGPLALTLVAQWATLPLTIPVFGRFSLIAPLANLLAGPLMSALLVAGLITVPLGTLAPAASALLALPVGLANASIWLASVLARAPYASLAADAGLLELLPWYLAALAAFLLWRDWRPRAMRLALCAVVLLICLWAARWRLFAPASVTVMDVGQADAILIRDGAGALLVDAGVDDEVVQSLARQHALHLDAVVITHWDADHWGGLPYVLDTLPVSSVYAAEGAAENAPSELSAAWGRGIGELSYGDALRVGGFTCRVVWPHAPVAGEENADSLCLEVAYEGAAGSLSVLLTGDTELEQEREYADEVGDVDVLKVGHHGSQVSVDTGLLEVLSPEVAVASAGEGNRYGHPSQACIEAVEESGALFLCTKDAGDVSVYPGEGHIRLASGGAASATLLE